MRFVALQTLTWATVAGAAASAVWLASTAPARDDGAALRLPAQWLNVVGFGAANAPARAASAAASRR